MGLELPGLDRDAQRAKRSDQALEDCKPLRAGDLRHDFTQTFTYDERGAVKSRTHPDCRDYTASMKLPVIGCCCPACGDLSLQRQRIKQLLMDLERDNVGVKNSMLKALSNVSPRHLLDTRLNPLSEVLEEQDTPGVLQIRVPAS